MHFCLQLAVTVPDCPVRAKAAPLTSLPERIENTLAEMDREMETKINDDTVRGKLRRK